MERLETEYLGFRLPHPFVAGASPLSDSVDGAKRLEDAGIAAIVLRSLYEEQLRTEAIATHEAMEHPAEAFGEAVTYFPDPGGFVLGPHAYLDNLRRIKEAVGVPVIASLNGDTPGGWLDHARAMQDAGADAIELNIYDVVVESTLTGAAIEDRSVEMVRRVREQTTLPLAVKLSPYYTSIPNFARRVRDAGADGLVLFNRYFEPDVGAESQRFESELSYSTRSELPLRLRWLAILSGSIDASYAVTGGVHTEVDAVKATMCGAHAVQLVSALLEHGPAFVTEMPSRLLRWLDDHEFESLHQIRASLSMERCPNPDVLRRAQYVHLLQTW